MTDPLSDHNAHLKSFPDPLLRDIARNESAPRDYRKAATEVLLARKSPLTRHFDLREFVEELEAELDGIQTEFPAPEEPKLVEPSGPFKTSVTTATMFGDLPPEKEPNAD